MEPESTIRSRKRASCDESCAVYASTLGLVLVGENKRYQNGPCERRGQGALGRQRDAITGVERRGLRSRSGRPGGFKADEWVALVEKGQRGRRWWMARCGGAGCWVLGKWEGPARPPPLWRKMIERHKGE